MTNHDTIRRFKQPTPSTEPPTIRADAPPTVSDEGIAAAMFRAQALEIRRLRALVEELKGTP